MPYTLPRFPLLSNIWHLGDTETQTIPPGRAPDFVNVRCQLAQPLREVTPDNAVGLTHRPPPAVIIRFPSSTQLSDGYLNTASPARVYGDIVEVPAGSGVFYGCQMSVTVGRGFANEHVRGLFIRLSKSTGIE